MLRLLFWPNVIALAVSLIADDPENTSPAKHVAAIKATTKDNFLIIDELLRNGFRPRGLPGDGANVILRRNRVNKKAQRAKGKEQKARRDD
jgi:hypothetical protein